MRVFGNVLYEFYGSSEMGINTFLRPEVRRRRLALCPAAPKCGALTRRTRIIGGGDALGCDPQARVVRRGGGRGRACRV